ncbi:LLM class flavin-dependent oxidoreductase [Kibdelosporangium philippinense]|uniref:LLM class flavin-dependent oxidoreductase n=1 Tax=Kibdelosporangium philippinense TaxID=211113 RepID=A0ABS8Z1G5_9PSEU|nr:LLM class flavin-dependent oxidoreductase [Kibdelosporangium philippinense]MCE7001769.1 LLM class flavin-dependent oxidoreductase [Kibdelosporangium philippinense]
MEIGIGLPHQDIVTVARRAEELGFDSVAAADVLIGDGTPWLEPIVVQSTVAAVTERVWLDFGVLSIPTRPVAMLAAQIQTLQHLSGNRVRLGLGIGGFPGTPFWKAVDAPTGNRGQLLDQALEILPKLITGESALGVTLAPAAPAPLLLVAGGNIEPALRRVAKYGDFWLTAALTPAEVAEAKAKLQLYAAEYARPAPRIHLGLHSALNDEPARERMVQQLSAFYQKTPEQIAEITLTGGPEQAAERMAEYAEAGLDELGIGSDGSDILRQLDLIAEAGSML